MIWAKVLLVLLPFLPLGKKHEFHSSLAEIQYNRQTKSLEVSLRVFTDDFTLAINEANGSKFTEEFIVSDKTKQLVQNYIVRHFSLVSPNKDVKIGKYIGGENELDATWLYIEFENFEMGKNYSFLNTILLEQFDDQTNVANIIFPQGKKSLIFTKDKKVIPFPF